MSKAHPLLPVLALAAALAVAACGRPAMVSFPAQTQPRMAAVRHWEILAGEVADRVKKALDANLEVALTPIDVVQECSGPFCEVFGRLLASQLVSRGLQVASRPEGVMALRYRVQVVGSGESADRTASEAALAMAGEAAAPAGPGAAEAAVTSELVYQNRYLAHHTGIYYVDAAEVALYGRPLPPGRPGNGPGDPAGRGVRITGE